MTDEWEFRTARGRGVVADGALRVENSLVAMARNQWTEREAWGRLLFLVSTATTLAGAGRLADAGRALADGSAEPWQAVSLAALALVGTAVLVRALRTKTVPLRRIRSAERIGDERLRIAHGDGGEREAVARDPRQSATDGGDVDHLVVETPTEDDADEAAELLRLKGIRVENARETADAEPASRTFRERLAEKPD